MREITAESEAGWSFQCGVCLYAPEGLERGQHSFTAVFAAAATLLQQRGGQYRPRGQTACRNAAQAAECAHIRRSPHGRVPPINGVHCSPSETGETSLIAVNCGSAMLPWVCHLLSTASVWSLERGSISIRFLIGIVDENGWRTSVELPCPRPKLISNELAP